MSLHGWIKTPQLLLPQNRCRCSRLLIREGGSCLDSGLVDISAKAGYALVGAGQADPYAQALEYYQVIFYVSIPCNSYSHPEQFDRE